MPFIIKNKKKKPQHKENYDYKYYNAYRNIRQAYMMAHPLCEMCLQKGKVEPSTECHHIKPFMQGRDDDEKMQLATDSDNLIALCKSCHEQMHHKKRIKNWL